MKAASIAVKGLCAFFFLLIIGLLSGSLFTYWRNIHDFNDDEVTRQYGIIDNCNYPENKYFGHRDECEVPKDEGFVGDKIVLGLICTAIILFIINIIIALGSMAAPKVAYVLPVTCLFGVLSIAAGLTVFGIFYNIRYKSFSYDLSDSRKDMYESQGATVHDDWISIKSPEKITFGVGFFLAISSGGLSIIAFFVSIAAAVIKGRDNEKTTQEGQVFSQAPPQQGQVLQPPPQQGQVLQPPPSSPVAAQPQQQAYSPQSPVAPGAAQPYPYQQQQQPAQGYPPQPYQYQQQPGQGYPQQAPYPYQQQPQPAQGYPPQQAPYPYQQQPGQIPQGYPPAPQYQQQQQPGQSPYTPPPAAAAAPAQQQPPAYGQGYVYPQSPYTPPQQPQQAYQPPQQQPPPYTPPAQAPASVPAVTPPPAASAPAGGSPSPASTT